MTSPTLPRPRSSLAALPKPHAGATRLAHGHAATFALLIALLSAAPRAGADTPQGVLEEIARCADLASTDERLRCFEAAAVRAKSVLAAPPGTTEASPARNPNESFGLPQRPAPVTRPEQFGKTVPPAEELQSITSTTSEFAKTARGKALFVLDNGQVWRQLDSDTTALLDAPARGSKVTIERGALGSYNLTVEGRNALIKVMRVR